jgi:hypothetical protein
MIETAEPICREGLGHLGGDVVDRALDLLPSARGRLAREAEVHQLDLVLRALPRAGGGRDLDVDVLWLDVVVDQSAVVDVGQRLEDLADDAVEVLEVERLGRLEQVLPLQVLLRVVAAGVVLLAGEGPEVEHLDQVRVLEPGQDPELVHEEVAPGLAGLEELEGQRPLREGVLDEEHLGHAALAQLALDAVPVRQDALAHHAGHTTEMGTRLGWMAGPGVSW